ncbi:MAG: leucyl/phenylalanyl-tRNA--protein transferase [Gammaproteobacteria bacterium]|nr:leucyl/phenylalanyl-tRNA--protein transferase [Gammaproteobacteria bacterium]MCW9005013.1 leucyl/phenylalanyl-tRNA--protein transferase [Gammaproteobacteria bacterium]MCW9055836.1 leucyl/phenylalanyl-tRNA--protein transferase [Gammaproteobacteria bacterium]
MIHLQWLDQDPDAPFPHLDDALLQPDGLLAAGGDLSVPRLLNAYRHGIFPWYNEGEPILWWSPDPRCILFPDKIKISRSLKKTLNKKTFEIKMDTAFADVMQACAGPRKDQPGTWITDDMFNAYQKLHQLGYAHSIECWQNNELVGGLYGIAIGQVFFGESMFSKVTDASKVALVYLCQYLTEHNFKIIDTQVHTSHLESMGAEMIPRDLFISILEEHVNQNNNPKKWTED